MFLVLGLFMIAIGLFLSGVDEKKFRNGNIISCADRDLPHKWRKNAKNEIECSVCYRIAGKRDSDEEY